MGSMGGRRAGESTPTPRFEQKEVYSTMEAPPPLPPFLARSLSALARNGSGSSSLLLPSFYSCQICLSSYEASKTNPDEPFKPFKLENCGHIFCEDCMQQYVVSKVEDGQVNLTCFFLHNEDDSLNTTSPTSTVEEANLPPAPPTSSSSWTLGLFNALLGLPPSNPSSRSGGSRPAGSAPASCSTSLSELDIRRLLIPAQSSSSSSSAMRASNAFAKYERFKYDKSHPTARRCPACDASNLNVSVPVPVQGVTLDALNDKKKGIQPDMTCEKCRANFCFYHSNSHPDKSCKEYLSSLPASGSGDAGSPSDTGDDLFSSPGGVFSLPDGVVKQCPSCSALCQKSGGCNQMKCANCGQNFCWLCCQVVDGGTFPDHFQFWNLSGCPNMQMSESANSASSSAARLSRFFAFLQILIVGPPSFLLSVVALCLCWPCASAADPPDVRTEKSTARKFRSRVLNCSSFWGNCLTTTIAAPVVFVLMLTLVPLGCLVGCCRLVQSCSRSRASQLALEGTRAPSEKERTRAPEIEAAAAAAAENSADIVVIEIGEEARVYEENAWASRSPGGGL